MGNGPYTITGPILPLEGLYWRCNGLGPFALPSANKGPILPQRACMACIIPSAIFYFLPDLFHASTNAPTIAKNRKIIIRHPTNNPKILNMPNKNNIIASTIIIYLCLDLRQFFVYTLYYALLNLIQLVF